MKKTFSFELVSRSIMVYQLHRFISTHLLELVGLPLDILDTNKTYSREVLYPRRGQTTAVVFTSSRSEQRVWPPTNNFDARNADTTTNQSCRDSKCYFCDNNMNEENYRHTGWGWSSSWYPYTCADKDGLTLSYFIVPWVRKVRFQGWRAVWEGRRDAPDIFGEQYE